MPLRRENDVFFLDAKVLKTAEEGGKLITPLGGAAAAGAASADLSGREAASRAPARVSSAGAGDAVEARGPTLPVVPTAEERERHLLTHLPFRSWCRLCVQGRAKDAAHHLRGDEEARGLPLIQMDFFFLGSKGQEANATGITVVETGGGAVGATGLPQKGRGLYVVQFIVHMISEWGFTDVVIQTDQEPAISTVATAVQGQRPHRTILRKSPRYSHASLGYAEARW